MANVSQRQKIRSFRRHSLRSTSNRRPEVQGT
nr:unnamed protein product [Callosobruchus chinensis]